MNTTVLNVQELKKSYKKFSFGPMSLELERGTAIALVGSNGSGKSTFFRILMNIIQPNSGTVEFFGENDASKEAEQKRKIGYVGELLDPFGALTIKELASLVSYWYPTWDREWYSQLIKRYNIDEGAKFGKSSKGTKKKVEFIFSISHRPSLLLLDEPSAGVDISSQRKMKEDLTAFMEDGNKSMIIATHNVEEVKQLCDYITVLRDGKIHSSFLKDDIYDKWGRIWLSEIPESLKQHPNVIEIEETPTCQFLTNDVSEIEKELQKENVMIINSHPVSIDEVIEYYIDLEK